MTRKEFDEILQVIHSSVIPFEKRNVSPRACSVCIGLDGHSRSTHSHRKEQACVVANRIESKLREIVKLTD